MTRSQCQPADAYMAGSTKLEFATAQGEVLIQPTAQDLLRAITEANK